VSDANDQTWIRLLWELSGTGRKKDGTHRAPTSAERKHIVRILRTLGTRKTHRNPSPPVDGYKQAMQWIDTLFHNADRVRTDSAFRARLQKIQNEGRARGYSPDLYRYLPKPWKGKNARAKRAYTANDLALRAQQLHHDEPTLTYRQIAARLGLEGQPTSLEKRIARYLMRSVRTF
jgi:hypothetical protein